MPLGNDRFGGASPSTGRAAGSSRSTAWTDRIATWQDELRRKVGGGADRPRERARGGRGAARSAKLTLEEGARGGRRTTATARRARAPLEVDVDRELARFGVVVRALPALVGRLPRRRGGAAASSRELGFDVVYLPPIHPIGAHEPQGPEQRRRARSRATSARRGRSARRTAATTRSTRSSARWDDFDAHGRRGEGGRLEIALDFAIQCSPDHPWLTEHPEWFNRRPDGTLKYAENPPKRYQDIYNVNFESEDWRGLWQALLDVVLHWVGRGVTVFRVDNPHTKPAPFWEWLIAEVRREHPDVIFLAEAFTRPAMMTTLAKAGFAQSYTYFTWKNTKRGARRVRRAAPRVVASSTARTRSSNTPDILHEYLQHGGPPAFEARLVLAATLSPTYGIYSGLRVVRERAGARRARRSTSTRRSTR